MKEECSTSEEHFIASLFSTAVFAQMLVSAQGSKAKHNVEGLKAER